MPKMRELENVVNDATLNSIFKSAIKRAAYVILITPSPPATALAWAKRARFEAVDRSGVYAVWTIEGELAESATFRALIDQYMADQQGVELNESGLLDIVDKWVARFVAQNI